MYSQTNEATEDEKDDFYNPLQVAPILSPPCKPFNDLHYLSMSHIVITGCNRHDVIVLMGDLNAKVGKENKSRVEVIGKHRVGNMNVKGERQCDFCNTNGFVVTRELFPHKDIHKTTWKSPDGRTLNQIDHVIVNGKTRTPG